MNGLFLTDGREISGKRLIKLLNRLVKFFDHMEKLSRKGFSYNFLESLILNGVTNYQTIQG